jgi:hypothetical protein
VPTSTQIADAPQQDYALENDLPEPPEAFPPDWEELMGAAPAPKGEAPAPQPESTPTGEALAPQSKPAPKEEAPVSQPEPALASSANDTPGNQQATGAEQAEEPTPAEAEQPAEGDTAEEEQSAFVSPPLAPAGLGVQSPAPAAEQAAPPIISPPSETAVDRQNPPKLIILTLRNSGDKARDVLHMRRVHGTMISYPGQDRFAFYVIEGRHGYQLEFPNDTTAYGDELRRRLDDLVGEKNVRVETITYQ